MMSMNNHEVKNGTVLIPVKSSGVAVNEILWNDLHVYKIKGDSDDYMDITEVIAFFESEMEQIREDGKGSPEYAIRIGTNLSTLKKIKAKYEG
jgi:hypothetical protein